METVSSAEFQRNIGLYQDKALVSPIMVTSNGRERMVLLSPAEYRNLKQLVRESIHASALSEDELNAITMAEVPPGHEHLDDELG